MDIISQFVYDETSPTCLRFKDTGEIAGYIPLNEYDYPYIYLKGRKLSVSLIIWALHGRELKAGHALIIADGNNLNCKYSNLKLVSLYQEPLK